MNNAVKFRYDFMLTFAKYFHFLNIRYALKQVCLSLESYTIVYCIQNSLDSVQLAVEYIKCNTHTTTNHLLHMQKNTRREKQTHSHSCPHLPCGYIDMLHAVLYKHVDTHTHAHAQAFSLPQFHLTNSADRPKPLPSTFLPPFFSCLCVILLFLLCTVKTFEWGGRMRQRNSTEGKCFPFKCRIIIGYCFGPS